MTTPPLVRQDAQGDLGKYLLNMSTKLDDRKAQEVGNWRDADIIKPRISCSAYTWNGRDVVRCNYNKETKQWTDNDGQIATVYMWRGK